MRSYEAMVIVDPRLDEASIRSAVERITGLIRSKGGSPKVDEWGRRRLAYPIDHLEEGHYVVAAFESESDLLDELNQIFRVGEEYVRAKIVRIPGPEGAEGGGREAEEPKESQESQEAKVSEAPKEVA